MRRCGRPRGFSRARANAAPVLRHCARGAALPASPAGSAMSALLVGFVLVALLGIAHHYGMIAIRHLMPPAKDGSQRAIITCFCSLLVLHTLEILAFAGAYAVLLSWPWMGTLGPDFDGTWSGLVHFSGMAFATLGYANFDADGPIRLVAMMESLGGFMVLTWSATFIYSISQTVWDRSGD